MSNARTLAGLIDDTNTRIKIPSGYGLDFADYGAEDSNSNTTVGNNLMDDYEEGTWTATYDSATDTGVYRKIGSVVYCQVTLLANAKSFTSITGMPFSSITGVNSNVSNASLGRVYGTNKSLSSLTFLQSGTSLLVYDGSGSSSTLTTNTNGTVRVDINITYLTN